MKALITSLEFGKSQLVSSRTQDVISVAAKSPNQYNKSLINHLNKDLLNRHVFEWNSHLESLSVQSKLLDVEDSITHLD